MRLKPYILIAVGLMLSVTAMAQEFGVVVRNAGYDGVQAYRIPGLVTSNAGTLIAIYDIRYNNARDLQEDIDIGVSRSTDGGRTWQPMIVAMDMKEWGGHPNKENGIGDPSILVDRQTGRLFIVATWTHALPEHATAWFNVGNGMEPGETAQLMISHSDDDGLTWSEPRNLTKMVKKPEWYFTFQGPGRGIQMEDGTLVFPMQYQDEVDRTPHSSIMVSHDHGETWEMGTAAWHHTTESQVAEVEPGVLMLNMRNDLKQGRIVCVTTDYGKTWRTHASSGRLIEPVCMASLLKVPAAENCLGIDLLLFSNPNHPVHRKDMTIKASLDGGFTWKEENSINIDEGYCWGYSCLTMIDKETVGILYESSRAHMYFNAVKLTDIVKNTNMDINAKALVPIPDADYAKGVSAPFCGVLDGKLLVGGGANFPDKPLLDGGAKKVYDELWAYDGAAWTLAGNMPQPAAYGATFSTGKAVYLVGGNVSGKSIADVYKLTYCRGKLGVKPIGKLPNALEQAGWSNCGNKFYLAGGTSDGKASKAILVSKDCKSWKEIAQLPSALVQPVIYATKKALYVWGGFDGETLEVSSKGYKLDLKTLKWSDAPDIPNEGTFTGATGITDNEGRLVVFGGVNREIFAKALHNTPEDRIPYLSMPPALYKFNQVIYTFDPATEQWTEIATTGKTALAGAGAAWFNGGITVVGGEIKPGVRTPDLFTIVR